MKNDENIQLLDESGDRKYFSIIPNFILEESNHWEQSLYLLIKSIAGEEGSCWASPNALGKRLRCSPNKVRETLKKLEERSWIKKVGTKGKTKPTSEYIIVDLWSKNILFYAPKDCSRGELSKKIVHGVNLDCSRGGTKQDIDNKNSSLDTARDKSLSVSREARSPREKMLRFLKSYQNSKEKTYQRLEKTLSTHTPLSNVQCDEVDNFVSYWTELNSTGKKQRWELEKTFELSRRLKTWFGRSHNIKNSFNKNESELKKKYSDVKVTVIDVDAETD